MNGGSTTLEQIGFLEALKDGPYDWLRPQVKAVNDPEERTRARRRATIADYFVGGINAITRPARSSTPTAAATASPLTHSARAGSSSSPASTRSFPTSEPRSSG